jgi:hypothetical protein
MQARPGWRTERLTVALQPSCLDRQAVDRLIAFLRAYRGEGVTNQYADCDPALERSDGPTIRVDNLRRYLDAFAGTAYLLVGEAAGYAGCRFSGIPFTGEDQITGEGRLPWAEGLGMQQSSLGELWRERSGTIVWQAFAGRRDCVLWNAFPWHPHGVEALSNRKPTRAELDHGGVVLRSVLDLFPHAAVYAIGRVSEDTLARLGVRASYIRHPSHGGKTAFTQAVRALPRRD